MIKTLLVISLIFVTVLAATPIMADTLVVDIDPPNSDTNPQWFFPSNPAEEATWLSGLLGGISVYLISKDEDENPLDDVPAYWKYAVLKYGVGAPSSTNPDHWAIVDDNGNFILELAGITGLPNIDTLSHVSYFGLEETPPPPVPEPGTLILLGAGLIGLAGVARKRHKK